jgi:hypothetical protein
MSDINPSQEGEIQLHDAVLTINDKATDSAGNVDGALGVSRQNPSGKGHHAERKIGTQSSGLYFTKNWWEHFSQSCHNQIKKHTNIE